MQTQQRILMAHFGGPRGHAVARQLRSAVSRGHLHHLIDTQNQKLVEQEFEKALASGSAASLAAVAPTGATAILSGTTSQDDYSVERDSYSVTKCTARNKKGKCTRKIKVPVYTIKEKCGVAVSGRATRVADGAVLFDRTFNRAASNSDSKERENPPSRRKEICDSAFSASVDALIAFVTPYTTNMRLDFHKVKGSDSTDKALEYVKMSKLDQARKILESTIGDASLSEEDRAWARYNLAVVQWATADFDGCIEQIGIAQETLGAESMLIDMETACREYVQ